MNTMRNLEQYILNKYKNNSNNKKNLYIKPSVDKTQDNLAKYNQVYFSSN